MKEFPFGGFCFYNKYKAYHQFKKNTHEIRSKKIQYEIIICSECESNLTRKYITLQGSDDQAYEVDDYEFIVTSIYLVF